ncbi:hypothetical protein C0J52_04124 [Blattella germanica]|nr:hypothetical protein C0J52_04124 [Blattella germanica]
MRNKVRAFGNFTRKPIKWRRIQFDVPRNKRCCRPLLLWLADIHQPLHHDINDQIGKSPNVSPP